MQIPIRPLLPLLLAALLAACTGMPSRRADLPSEMDAQTLFLQGDFGAAADAWLQLARANRGQRARYRLRAAEAYREEGDSAAMQALVGEIDRRKLPSEDLFRLDLMEAELALGRQDAAAALALLATPEGSLPPEYAPRYHELRARAYAVQGAPLDAVAERVALDALLAEGADQEANAEQIRQLVATLSEADLRTRLREADRDDPLYPWLLAGARAQAQARGAGGS
ncbi:MAG: hypothetical protein DYH17_10655, partial [Xanthomonadales bacterium PRO6]|nr:hypothetical protein [Xanthomonadales bacterium PRO6]